MRISGFSTVRPNMSDTRLYEDLTKFLGDKPARLGLIATLYDGYTASHLTEALFNTYTLSEGKKNSFQSVNSFMIEWDLEVKEIHRVPMVAAPKGTGENAGDIISIYEKYPDKIKGFGELKCYSEYIHGKLPYGNLDWIKPILEYNKDLGLPVYIHYNLESKEKIKEFNQLVEDYNFPIVLCHCGMYDNCDNDLIHETLVELMKTYSNLYVDVSYTAVDYYLNNPNKLLEFDNKKVIIGTDINSVIDRQIDNPESHCKELYNKFYKLHRLGNFNIAIKNIFALN